MTFEMADFFYRSPQKDGLQLLLGLKKSHSIFHAYTRGFTPHLYGSPRAPSVAAEREIDYRMSCSGLGQRESVRHRLL